MWTAFYAPKLNEGQEDPTKDGFITEEAAWTYVFDNMCDGCKESRLRALNGEESKELEDGSWDFVSLHPSCACEWFVIKTEDYEKADGFDDILKASGCKLEWSKDQEDVNKKS